MKQVTIKEIAEKTGFSVNTVSRALANRGEIKKETADIIRKAAEEMGYLPNLLARGLSGKQTNIIGLIMGETQNPYHWPVVGIIQKELTRRGLSLVLANSEETEEGLYNAVNLLLSTRVDGMLMFYPDKGEEALKLLQKHLVPTVLLSTRTEFPISYVDFDEEKGGYLAASYLIQRGCRKIAYIGREGDTAPSRDRRAGYLRALREHGMGAGHEFVTESSLQGGYALGTAVDFKALGIDGIVAHNDLIAMGVSNKLSERGVTIPGDISVIGFDNIQYGEFAYPPLTTVDTMKEQIATEAVEMLLRNIQHKMETNEIPFDQMVLDTQLIVRKSTR